MFSLKSGACLHLNVTFLLSKLNRKKPTLTIIDSPLNVTTGIGLIGLYSSNTWQSQIKFSFAPHSNNVLLDFQLIWVVRNKISEESHWSILPISMLFIVVRISIWIIVTIVPTPIGFIVSFPSSTVASPATTVTVFEILMPLISDSHSAFLFSVVFHFTILTLYILDSRAYISSVWLRRRFVRISCSFHRCSLLRW